MVEGRFRVLADVSLENESNLDQARGMGPPVDQSFARTPPRAPGPKLEYGQEEMVGVFPRQDGQPSVSSRVRTSKATRGIRH